jgi:hypothetical protein
LFDSLLKSAQIVPSPATPRQLPDVVLPLQKDHALTLSIGRLSAAGHWRNYVLENRDDPEPKDDKGKILKKLADAADEEIKRVETEIERIKN